MSQIATALRLMKLGAGLSLALGAQPIQITSFPVGSQPMGVATIGVALYPVFENYAVVANSGDSSLSIYNLGPNQLATTIRGIPDAHAVIQNCGCGLGLLPGVIVTSPSDNSVSFVQFPSGPISNASITKVSVGKQPVSAACFPIVNPDGSFNRSVAVISNYGDQSVTLIDAQSYNVIATVPNVPGSPGLHGIGGVTGNSPVAWIAGTDANVDMTVEIPLFCTPSGITCGPGGGILLITSRDANSLIIARPPPGIGGDFSLRSAAGTGDLAPGGLGSALFVTTGASGVFTANPPALPTTLGNVTLKIGGPVALTPSGWVELGEEVQVPLLYVDPRQINFQVPPGTSPSTAISIARIERADGTEAVGNYLISAAAPALFTLNGTGFGAGAVLNQDNSVNSPSNPAPRGSVIQIFATGGGDTTPLLGPGQAAPANGDPLIPMNVTPLVLIGTLKDQALNGPGELLFNGLAPGLLGVWQVNARIPQNTTPGSQVALSLYLLGSRTQSIAVTIAVN